eukprot:CAMPEP_0197035008 /NCGR_PEP_ID=MMETSP1384-20130603/12915_1 /TAXON_ID=29189 /ORGANISM="Ammonia sp." /LENGTH=393 /DNA_ID=CAMNT_0042464997 /DNA_START=9 /DNA_END=1187 /DNA_ORIENTATION=+
MAPIHYFSFSSTTPVIVSEMECWNLACFWTHCKGWLLAWYLTAAFDLLCACWALFEIMHIYASIWRIRSAFKHSFIAAAYHHPSHSQKNDDSEVFGSNYMVSFTSKSQQRSSLKPQRQNSPNRHLMNNQVAQPNAAGTPLHSRNNSSMQMFETRKSQKLFLFIIFIESLSRTYLFADAPFALHTCTMTKVDKPTLLYAIVGNIAPNLFCYAFSCLAYELSKIYISLTQPKEYDLAKRRKSIQHSLWFIIVLVFLITAQSIVMAIFFVLYFHDKSKYEHVLRTFEMIDYYSYGAFCLVLGVYFIRFAFPIYGIYKQILQRIHYERQHEEPVIESSISSHDVAFDSYARLAREDGNGATKKKKHSSTTQSAQHPYVTLQATHTLNYFVASMKRTW